MAATTCRSILYFRRTFLVIVTIMCSLLLYIHVTKRIELISFSDDLKASEGLDHLKTSDRFDDLKTYDLKTSEALDQFVIIVWPAKHFMNEWSKQGVNEWTVQCGNGLICNMTFNHSLLPYADAVLFHGFLKELPQHIRQALSVPVLRPTHQYWIYYNTESSIRSKHNAINIAQYEPLFNWTMTYRLDSDIVFRSGLVLPGKHLDGFNSKRNYLEGKTKIAFAVISNCFKPRLNYIHKLQKYIDIDLYGKCRGHKSFCRNCWNTVKYRYKFYLAFENSLCADYITEKTYKNAFDHEVVPVIMSGANLSNPLLMPQGSYVDARSYSNAKELATYLMEASNNSTLYNNFFKWRAKWKIVDQWDYKGFDCSICEKLYESKSKKDVKIYRHIYNWFYKSKECVDWKIINEDT